MQQRLLYTKADVCSFDARVHSFQDITNAQLGSKSPFLLCSVHSSARMMVAGELTLAAALCQRLVDCQGVLGSCTQALGVLVQRVLSSACLAMQRRTLFCASSCIEKEYKPHGYLFKVRLCAKHAHKTILLVRLQALHLLYELFCRWKRIRKHLASHSTSLMAYIIRAERDFRVLCKGIYESMHKEKSSPNAIFISSRPHHASEGIIYCRACSLTFDALPRRALKLFSPQ